MCRNVSAQHDSDEEMDEPEKAPDNDADQDEATEELDEDAKRAITYQIAKNKGLTPHKKKELRNPRVKHRMKFRKAVIRRKGQVMIKIIICYTIG